MKHRNLQTGFKIIFALLIVLNISWYALCYNDLEIKGIARAMKRQKVPSGENFKELSDPIIYNNDEILVTASLSLPGLETSDPWQDYDRENGIFFNIMKENFLVKQGTYQSTISYTDLESITYSNNKITINYKKNNILTSINFLSDVFLSKSVYFVIEILNAKKAILGYLNEKSSVLSWISDKLVDTSITETNKIKFQVIWTSIFKIMKILRSSTKNAEIKNIVALYSQFRDDYDNGKVNEIRLKELLTNTDSIITSGNKAIRKLENIYQLDEKNLPFFIQTEYSLLSKKTKNHKAGSFHMCLKSGGFLDLNEKYEKGNGQSKFLCNCDNKFCLKN